jgi:hypothetical protein
MPGLRLGRPITILSLVLGSALLCLVRFDATQVGFFNDDAHYIVLAESLATGHGYHLINYPHAPIEPAFPPGWPLLLTPLAALFPGHYTPLKLCALLFWLATIPLVYRLFAPRLRSPYLEGFVGLVAINPQLVGQSGMVMSEAAYLFFSILTLNLFDKWKGAAHQNRVWGLIVLLAASFTLTIRAIGLSLLLAIMFYLLVTRDWRSLLLGCGVLLLGMVPLVWFFTRNSGASAVFSSSAYYRHFLDLTSQWVGYARSGGRFLVSTGEAIMTLVLPGSDSGTARMLVIPVLRPVLGICLVLTIMVGFLLALRRLHVTELYFVFYMSIFYFWTVYIKEVQPRQLIPMVVFFYFYGFYALSQVTARVIHRKQRLVTVLTSSIVGLAMLLSLAENYQAWREPLRNRIADLTIGTTWLRENVPAESVVMSPNAVVDYLYVRRKTVDYPGAKTDVLAYVKAHDIDYIIIKPDLQMPRTTQLNELTVSNLLPAIESNSNYFQLVYQDSTHNVSVYRVIGLS